MPPVPKLQKDRDALQIRDTTYNLGSDLKNRIADAANASPFYRREPQHAVGSPSQKSIEAAMIHIADRHGLCNLAGLKSLRDHAEWGDTAVTAAVELQEMRRNGSEHLLAKYWFHIVPPPDHEAAYRYLLDPASRQASAAEFLDGDLQKAYESFGVGLIAVYRIDLPIIALGVAVLASAYYGSDAVPLPAACAVAVASVCAAMHVGTRLEDRAQVRKFTKLQQHLAETAVAYQDLAPVESTTCRSFGQYCNEVLTHCRSDSSAADTSTPKSFIGSPKLQNEILRAVDDLRRQADANGWTLVPLHGEDRDETMRTAWQYELFAPAALEQKFKSHARGKSVSRGFHGSTLRALAEMMKDGPQTRNFLHTPNGARRFGPGFYLAQHADWALHWGQRSVANMSLNAGQLGEPAARIAAVGLFDMALGDDCEIVPGHAQAVVHGANSVLLRRIYLYDTEFWEFRISQGHPTHDSKVYEPWNKLSARKFWLDSDEGSYQLLTSYTIGCGIVGIAAAYATQFLYLSARHQPSARCADEHASLPTAAMIFLGLAAGYALYNFQPEGVLTVFDAIYEARRRRLERLQVFTTANTIDCMATAHDD